MSVAVVSVAAGATGSGATVSVAVLSTSVAVSAGFEEQAAATTTAATAKNDAMLIFIVKCLNFPFIQKGPPGNPIFFRFEKFFSWVTLGVRLYKVHLISISSVLF